MTFKVIGNVVKYVSTADILSKKLQVFVRLWKNGPNIAVLNGLLALLFDSILGILVIRYVLGKEGDVLGQCAGLLNRSCEAVASQLQDLLKWLMGTPAGLKLNAPLNELLGHIFTYYVTVWQQYCGLIEPYVNVALRAVLFSGVLGWTLQMACLLDLLALLTFHIICIYVHAARLYALFYAVLTCTFRLFRGRKWNPLRLRVDHARFDTDALFVGTLLFTLALFLMPTAFVYYAIFAGFNCVLKLLTSAARRCIGVFLDFPYAFFFAWFLHAECVRTEQYMQLVATTGDSVVCRLSRCRMPLRAAISSSRFACEDVSLNDKSSQASTSTRSNSYFRKLMTGELL